jgi:signal transduction histidine kinase
MLHQFLTNNRAELIRRCRSKVALRRAPQSHEALFEHGIPLFVDQLARTLRLEQTPAATNGASGAGPALDFSEIKGSAINHGRELLEHGFPVDQVVHDYGDLCQAITELASQLGKPIQIDEFRSLNRCLDNAIADAVTGYSYAKNLIVAEQGMLALNKRLGFVAHELRNHLHTASLALLAIRSGKVGLEGPTGALLDRSLIGLGGIIDRSLAEVRMTAGIPVRKQLLSVAEIMTEIRVSATLEAQARNCTLSAPSVTPGLMVHADRDLLTSAMGNLLQNAFKFTRPGTEVAISAYASACRILIDVADCCGGLPAGAANDMFVSFSQRHADKSGLGLGLSISKHNVEANDGFLRVRDVPGSGCVFTIDLPRQPDQAPSF